MNALAEYDVVWRPHWPGGACDSDSDGGSHRMHLIDITDTWYCGGCEVWFAAADVPAVTAYAQRATMLAATHQN